MTYKPLTRPIRLQRKYQFGQLLERWEDLDFRVCRGTSHARSEINQLHLCTRLWLSTVITNPKSVYWVTEWRWLSPDLYVDVQLLINRFLGKRRVSSVFRRAVYSNPATGAVSVSRCARDTAHTWHADTLSSTKSWSPWIHVTSTPRVAALRHGKWAEGEQCRCFNSSLGESWGVMVRRCGKLQ